MKRPSSNTSSLSLLLLLLFSIPSYAQLFTSAEVNLRGLTSTKEELPFWMYHNQRGRVSEETNFSGWISGKAAYHFNHGGILEAGGGLLFQDQFSDQLFVDELYAQYNYGRLQITAGRKQRPELYNGLSASNENILWSLNARPLSGLQVRTPRPVFLLFQKRLGFEASWEEYLMEEDRHVSNARLHHKSFHLVLQPTPALQIKVGLQHFVQWAGTSATHGEQPHAFEDYLRIITGQGGGGTATLGDQQNALGNNLGSYEVIVNARLKDSYISIFWNSIFEDGSGRRLGNTPDGRYGIFYEDLSGQNKLVNSVIYEFFYTEHQSNTTTGPHKNDNFFNNGVYRSGWTYHDRVLGAPFFTPNPNGTGIINNKFKAHHLGIGGFHSSRLHVYPYKLVLSYARNHGRLPAILDPKQDVFYALYDITLLQRVIEVNFQFGAEYNSYTSPIYGAGVHLKYRL